MATQDLSLQTRTHPKSGDWIKQLSKKTSDKSSSTAVLSKDGKPEVTRNSQEGLCIASDVQIPIDVQSKELNPGRIGAKKTPCKSTGLAHDFETRPEYLWGTHTMVVDASTLTRERLLSAKNIKIYKWTDVFSEEDTVLGFGVPNVFLVIPNEKAGEKPVKFAAKSFRRAPASIDETRGLTQSGINLRFKNLPPGAVEALWVAMKNHVGEKNATCVNANARVLHEAGFTSGGKPINRIYFPVKLLRTLLKQGLEYKGQKIDFDVVKTTSNNLENHGWRVIASEVLVLKRHLIDPIFKRFYFWRKWGANKARRQPERIVAPELPDNVDYKKDIRVRMTRSSKLGGALRAFWGPHVMYEVQQSRVDVNDHLPRTLQAFPKKNRKWWKPKRLFATVKEKFLFSKPVIWGIRKILAKSYDSIGSQSEKDIYKMLRTHTEEQPNKYNMVVTKGHPDKGTEDRIVIGRLQTKGFIRSKFMDWVLAKHVLLSGYDDDVRYACEVYKDQEGVIHINMDSGTYQPGAEELKGVVAFIRAVFPHLKIVGDVSQ